MNKMAKPMLLSGNALKIIAAFFMLIDHIGYILYPEYIVFRIIGRLSFPIFAFMIAEGAHYTKNKLKYFSGIFVLAIICQIFYYIYDRSTYMGILVTFSISILLIYLLQFVKKQLFLPEATYWGKVVAVLIFLLAVVTVYLLNIYLDIDYGFWGCMAPVFATFFKNTEKKLNNLTVNIIMFGLGLVILFVSLGKIQYYSLLALLLLFLYSGKRGKGNMKMFFYVFYPLHILVLQMINMLFFD